MGEVGEITGNYMMGNRGGEGIIMRGGERK